MVSGVAEEPHPQPYNSWGNGSAMRVAPVGWAFDTLAETEALAKILEDIGVLKYQIILAHFSRTLVISII